MYHVNKCLMCAMMFAALFFVLSPGVLLTLPPACKGKVFMAMKDDKCCATSCSAAAVHALVFGLVVFVLMALMKKK